MTEYRAAPTWHARLQELLESHASDLLKSWLTPEAVAWPQHATTHGLQHLPSSWPAAQPCLAVLLSRLPAREAVHLLPVAGRLMAAACEHTRACVQRASARAAIAATPPDEACCGRAEHADADTQPVQGSRTSSNGESDSDLDSLLDPDDVASTQDAAAAPTMPGEAHSEDQTTSALHAAAAESAASGNAAAVQSLTWLLRCAPALYAELSRKNVGLQEDVCALVATAASSMVRRRR
jgi:hypothetical protein